MSGQCLSCGYRFPASVLATGGDCPRCGDPVAPHGATVTVEPQPENALPDAPTVTAGPQPDATPGSTLAFDGRTPAPDSALPAPAPRFPSVPGYEVLELIGRGGMGVVYKAQQRTPRRLVALKMILSGGHAARFQTEVAAVARLQHPNVVQIHEVGEVGGRPYFSMEYVPGGSLATRLEAGPLPTRDAAHLVAQVARAVQHAHDRGIIHRDLKPGNILLVSAGRGVRNAEPNSEGERTSDSSPSALRTPRPALDAKIADFGLAKYLEGSADGTGPRTQSGAIMGTPSYMAPEQAKGKSKAIGPAADTYALGAILYECLTGRPPFRADSQLDTLMKVISDDPVPPRQVRAGVPRDLEVICLKCLRKDPKDRYATAGAVADDLEAVLDGRPIAARARTTRERVGGWARRRREALALVGGAALVLAVAVAAIALWPASRRTPVPPVPVEPAANLPPDLSFVPPDALAFATVRVADLWANPAVRELADHQAKLRGTPNTLDGIGAEIEAMTSIPPTNIERATFVVLSEDGTRRPLIVLSTVQPYAHDRLRDALTKGGKHLPQTVGARTVYVPAEKRDRAFWALSDRVLLIGDTETVWEAATRPLQGVGPLTHVLERAAQGHALVAGVQMSQETIRHELQRWGLPAETEPVTALRAIGVTADLTHPTGADGQVTIELSGTVAFPSAAHADAARPHVPPALRALIGQVTSNSDLLALFRPFDPIFAAVKGAAWERTGDTLTARAGGTVTVRAVKEQLEEAIRQEAGVANMREIVRALARYHDEHGRFPPAVVTDEAGKPLYSWRVLVLPYLGGETVYRRFHLNRAWDHPSNRALLDQMPAAFGAAGAKPGGNTTPYQVLTGSGGLFDTPDGRTVTDITDGTARTLLFVEAPDPVPWSKPADLPFDPARPPTLRRPDASGFHAAFADGSVRFIPHAAATPELLRALFTRAGGEAVTLP